MTDLVAVALITAIPGSLGAIGGIVAGWFSYKASGHAKEAAVTSKAVERNTDGLHTELMNLNEKSARAEGNLEGRKDLIVEQATLPHAAIPPEANAKEQESPKRPGS